MNNDKIGEQISAKLSALIALAMSPDAQKRTQGEKVRLLARFGISNQDVADILGTTKGSVEVLKSLGKRKR